MDTKGDTPEYLSQHERRNNVFYWLKLPDELTTLIRRRVLQSDEDERKSEGRWMRTASTAGKRRGGDADAEGRGLFFMGFTEDDLSSLFKPTDRLDMTARACASCVSSTQSVCVCVCFRQLGLDLVPRQEFSMVDPDEISVTELYRLVSVLHILPLEGATPSAPASSSGQSVAMEWGGLVESGGLSSHSC